MSREAGLSSVGFCGTIFAVAEMVIEQKQEWERAEITRSRCEALHTPTERLVQDERQVVRYLDPPLDTSYPLEYAYALLGNLAGRVVLDFGCRSGHNSPFLAPRGAPCLRSGT